jgi:hypothetical protein
VSHHHHQATQSIDSGYGHAQVAEAACIARLGIPVLIAQAGSPSGRAAMVCMPAGLVDEQEPVCKEKSVEGMHTYRNWTGTIVTLDSSSV